MASVWARFGLGVRSGGSRATSPLLRPLYYQQGALRCHRTSLQRETQTSVTMSTTADQGATSGAARASHIESTKGNTAEAGELPSTPYADRNKGPILADALLPHVLPTLSGIVLEVGSLYAQHIEYFAQQTRETCPSIQWLPSDCTTDHFEVISQRCASLPHVLAPVQVDLMNPNWGQELKLTKPDVASDICAIYLANVVHISPWQTTLSLFQGARDLDKVSTVAMYGPFLEGDQSVESNLRFSASLASRNPTWAVRELEDVKEVARKQGFVLKSALEMPSNNKVLVFERNVDGGP
eukprot:m.191387 g.191387  ORF g.191387 m.191387 type:complete len:296 (+) comp14840_c0_seq2:124-1011(+)